MRCYSPSLSLRHSFHPLPIQSYEEAEEKSHEIISAHVANKSYQNTENASTCEDSLIFQSNPGCQVCCTPVGESRGNRPFTVGSRTSVWPASLSDALSSWCGGKERSASQTFSFVSNSRTLSNETDTDFSRYGDPDRKSRRADTDCSGSGSGSTAGRHTSNVTSVSSILWEFVSHHIEKLSDTDMQTACLV